MPEREIEVVMFGGVYGEYYVASPRADANISRLTSQCIEAGITKFIPNVQIGAIDTHPWVICHRPAGLNRVEFRGEYWINEYGEKSPLRILVQEGHRRGLEIQPYVHVACAGAWLPKLRSPVGERIPLGYATQFGSQHPEYWTRLRNGHSWLDLDTDDRFAGYGYLSLAYPEVRAYERALFEEFVSDYGTDGVSLEFVTVMKDEQGVWPFGYDEPAIQAYIAQYGMDPRRISNADEAWTRLRAGYVTQFFREVRDSLQQARGRGEISMATEGIWHDPAAAYRNMLDWPAWLDEGLVDVLYPRFWLFAPPDLGSSWETSTDQIREGVKAVTGVAQGRCRVYGGLICASFGGEVGREEMADLLIRGAKAVMDAGANGVAIHRIDTIVALDLWDVVKKISQGEI